MRRYAPKILTFTFILLITIVISGFVVPHVTHAVGEDILASIAKTIDPLYFAQKILGAVAEAILRLVALITGIAGVVLNGVIYYTVGQMSATYTNITGINAAWTTIRDLANMGFIFILLYAAIKTILGLGGDTKNLIKNIIIVAVLINFSLFFTKIVIDISNILAILFYDAIAPGALTATSQSIFQSGLSNAFMSNLNLQNLYKVTTGIPNLFIIATMGSIMLLIAAFVFIAAALFFVIRYVVLILVLILSPIAFMSFVLPELKTYRDQWWNALTGQAFFAPIYLMLTWVTVTVLGGANGITNSVMNAYGASGTQATLADLTTQFTSPQQGNVSLTAGAIAMFLNFIIVIVFLIASLLISKKYADRAGGGINKLTGAALGFAGGATFGLAARQARNSFGSRAAAMLDDEKLKQKAAEGSVRARLQLAAASKVTKSSFDIRGTGIGGALQAGKVKKGSTFEDEQKERAKFYGRYKPSSGAIGNAKEAEEEAKETLDKAEKRVRDEAGKTVAKSLELKDAERQLAEAQDRVANPRIIGLTPESLEVQKKQNEAALAQAQERVNTLRSDHEKTIDMYVAENTSKEKLDHIYARERKDKLLNRMENMAKRMEKERKLIGPISLSGVFVSGKTKANAIRSAAKGKSTDQQIAELAKKKAEEEGDITPPAQPPAAGTP